MYIYATDTCTINGIIDVRGKRLTLNGPNGISNFLNINDVKYNLAKGGNTVKGGNGGRAGYPWLKEGYYIENTPPTEEEISQYRYEGGKASEIIYAGNINGGGVSSYGIGATGFNNGIISTYDWWKISGTNYVQGENGKTVYQNGTGAVILCALNLNLGENGIINCTAVDGIFPTENTLSSITSLAHSCEYNDYFIGGCGNGGNGTGAPSGGGPITIITENFINNGKLLTNGSKIIGEIKEEQPDATLYNSSYGWGVCPGSGPGEGGTFISQAGEIKIYIVGEQ